MGKKYCIFKIDLKREDIKLPECELREKGGHSMKKRKIIKSGIAIFALTILFSLVAFADSYQLFSYTTNSQTLTSDSVEKSNLNTTAKATALNSYGGSFSNALDNGGVIEAYSALEYGGNPSGTMIFSSDGQTRYGSYSKVMNNQEHKLFAKLLNCNFTGVAMYEYFQWLP